MQVATSISEVPCACSSQAHLHAPANVCRVDDTPGEWKRDGRTLPRGVSAAGSKPKAGSSLLAEVCTDTTVDVRQQLFYCAIFRDWFPRDYGRRLRRSCGRSRLRFSSYAARLALSGYHFECRGSPQARHIQPGPVAVGLQCCIAAKYSRNLCCWICINCVPARSRVHLALHTNTFACIWLACHT